MSNYLSSLCHKRRQSGLSRTASNLTSTACALAMFAGATIAANSQPTATAIYAGGSPQSAGVILTGSGSGSLTPDAAHVFAGGGSLKLVTQGLYQGGIIRLEKPYDLGPLLNNKNAYIQVAFLPPPPPTGGAGAQGNSGSKYGAFPPGGFGAPNTGGSAPNAGSQYGTLGSTTKAANVERFTKAHALENLRVVFVTGGGHEIDKKSPVKYANDEAGWKVLSFPVSSLTGLSAADSTIKEVRVYGDTTGTIYIGKIGTVVDTTSLMIEPIPEKTVTANEKYRYTASAHGGATPLIYSWDWDDRDGIQDEAEGKSAAHLYRKPGDYKVTVTVIDPYGIKAPVSTKFNVHIP